MVKVKFMYVLAFLLLCFIYSSHSRAATINAVSCSQADVQAAYDSASNGDTILVPAGSATWTTARLKIQKEVALIGAGIGKTNITTQCPNGQFFIASGVSNWRISGFSFITTNSNLIAIWMGSDLYDFRIDNCEFRLYHFGIFMKGAGRGVIDHNYIYGGGFQIWGNDDWSENTNLGSADFIFLENNTYTNEGALADVLHVMSSGHAVRYVFRYNTIIEHGSDGITGAVDAHGYCHGLNCRAARAYEIYENTFFRANREYGKGVYLRGGTGVVYNNTFNISTVGYSPGTIFLSDVRANGSGGTGESACSSNCSTSPFCRPEDGGEGYPCCDQIGRGKNQQSEPLYVWNNKDHNGNPILPTVESTITDYIQLDRDYKNVEKPNYIAYTYPHPLTSSGAIQPNAPTDVRIIEQ